MHSFSKWSHGTLSLSLSVSLNDPSFCCHIWALLNLSETQTTPLLIRKCGGVEMGKIVSVFVVLGFLVLNCFANFGSHAQRLPDDEGKFTICQQHITVLIFFFFLWYFLHVSSLKFGSREFEGKESKILVGVEIIECCSLGLLLLDVCVLFVKNLLWEFPLFGCWECEGKC